MKPNMYVRINSKENVVAMLSDRHRQLVIMGDALFQSFMSLILTIKEKGSVQRNGVSITYADFRRDHNGPIGKGYDHIWEYIESLEMFKFGLNSYYFLVNQEEDSVSDWSSHASVYPLDGLEEFVRTYIIIMIDRLVSIIGLSGVQTSLSL